MNRRGRLALRSAKKSDVRALHALISSNLQDGHLLPRTLAELGAHVGRFVVATRGRRIVGCAELAALSPQVGEVRSLVVDRDERGHGVGGLILDELRRRARTEEFDKLCAFTHAPGYFIPMGFSIVPHSWLPEKVTTDCIRCPLFRSCGQYAMVVPIESPCEVDRRPASEPMVVRYA